MNMDTNKHKLSGIAVMASLSDYGLTGKEARGVYAEETALPKPLAAAMDSIQRFSKRLGFSLEGTPRELAAKIDVARRQAPGSPAIKPSTDYSGPSI